MKKLVVKIKENSNIVVQILCVMVIAFMCLCDITKMNYPVINGDAFGYWSNAVSMSGYDWTDLISRNAYYSWGYSLWLVPIVKILPHGLWYKAAIILNAMFLIASYFLAYRTARILFPQVKNIVISLVALVVIIYPCNILYAQETWTESLLYMLMWCATFLVVSMDVKFSYHNFFLLYVILGYMYIVHARCIGIVGVGIVISVIILCRNKKNIIPGAIAIAVLGVMYFANNAIKDYIIGSFYGNSETSGINNVGLDSGTVVSYLTKAFTNIGMLFKSLTTKSAYVFLMSGFSIIPAAFMCVYKIVRLIKERKDELLVSHIWCVTAFMASLALCSLQMMDWSVRKDLAVYSRYFENAGGPLLMLGIIYLIEASPKIRLSVIAGYVINLLVMPHVLYYIYNAGGYFNSVCSPAFGALYDNTGSTETLGRLIFGIESFFIMIPIACIVINEKKFTTIFTIAMYGVMYIIINIAGRGYLLDYREALDNRLEPMRTIIESEENAKVYYLCESIRDDSAESLQYMLYSSKIQVVEDETEVTGDAAYILSDKVIVANDDAIYNVMYQRDGVYLYKYERVN